MRGRGSGPAWLGIGAQRAGTTWFTNLLCQHPSVSLGGNDRKEQFALHKVADGRLSADDYASLFGPRQGEFTPHYMRSLQTVRVVADLCARDIPVIALLRDPVERFASAMRLHATMRKPRFSYEAAITLAQWTGMYADQLDVWTAELGSRLVVFQYERIRHDPQPAVDEVWRRIGVDPVPLTRVGEPSAMSSRAAWTWPDGLCDALVRLYRPQVDRLADRGDIDPLLWPRFAGAYEPF